jgi:tungstate transport system substrate-binding protein
MTDAHVAMRALAARHATPAARHATPAARHATPAARHPTVAGVRAPPAGVLLAVLLASACAQPDGRLVLATTSSACDAGLLDHLLAAWHAEQAPPRIDVLVTGSGEALALGRRGDADVLLVHAPEAEAAFVEAGLARSREPVMRSDFVLVGPAHDPAGVRAAGDLAAAFRAIARAGTFVSRGDDSGTHQRELRIREHAGLADPRPDRGSGYIDAGQGMAETLRMAAERRAYTLTDHATFAAWRSRLELVELVEFALDDTLLHNPYSIIVPRATRDSIGAARFAAWLTGPRAQRIVADFAGPGGTPLFTPAR